MLAQLPEEKRDLIKPLFQKKQPNNSALWSYFDGKMTGKTFVDDMNAPTKAICRLDMSWTYISDDADLPWIEEALSEIIKKDWLQVIWVPERRGSYPLKEFGKIIPRFEFIERKEALEKPCDVEITPFTSDLFDKLPETGEALGKAFRSFRTALSGESTREKEDTTAKKGSDQDPHDTTET